MYDLTIREAVEGDIPAILAMHAGEDCDYLPDYLPYYMKQPDHTCLVAEKEHDIVAFWVMNILDAGLTVLWKAARVHEAVRNIGIATALVLRLPQLTRSKGCTREVICIESTSPYITSGTFEKKPHTEICRKPYQLREVHAGVILPAPGDEKALGSLSDQTLEAYICNPHIRHYLFPCDIIYVDNVPYRALTANIPLLRGRQTTFYSDVSFERERENVTGMMSAGTSWRYRTGAPAYIIDLFGADVSSVQRHIVMNVNQSLNIFARNKVLLCVHYDNDQNIAKAVQTIFTGLQLRVNEVNGGCAVVLEKNLVPSSRY